MSSVHAVSDASPQRRAIGIIRVSQTKGREGERFVSPEEQRERIEDACARDGLKLLTIYEELDVSGGKSLANRPGLSAAVAAVEAGEADVIAAAYFDRLFRSLSTQAEVLDRIERAGGQVLAVDVGRVTNGSAGQWLSGTMMGAVSEYFRRSAKERSAEGQAKAVARGAMPWSHVPIGYARRDDGTLEPDPQQVPIARKVFEMRAERKPISAIRKMLKAHGIERSFRGVQTMLSNRAYLGEIHFGKLVNLRAHEPIIDHELWQRVQRMRAQRGRLSKSDRLLARLGVLRCGCCGARLTAMKLPRQDDYPIYRCPSTNDCPRHVTISAEIAEEVVSSAVRKALADAEGRASAAESARKAVADRDAAQANLDAAIRTLTAAGLINEPSAVEQLTELREVRDEKQAKVDQIGPEASRTVNAADDWDSLSLEARRALIRASVKSAIVAPANRGGPSRRERAAERITVHLFSE
jgi:DNA invertase Pin-like site-specific DNA recombinase